MTALPMSLANPGRCTPAAAGPGLWRPGMRQAVHKRQKLRQQPGSGDRSRLVPAAVSGTVVVKESVAQQQPAVKPDWRLSLALAGKAFQAYIKPVEGQKGIPLTTPGGVEVMFVDKDFLRSMGYQGIMEVHIQSAAELPNRDIKNDKSDPYAVLTIGDSVGRTKAVQNMHDPQWNETLRLFVSDLASERLKVRVLDEDRGGVEKADRLGDVEVPLKDLLEGRAKEPLTIEDDKGKATGSISLQVKYRPMEEVIEEVVGALPPEMTDGEWSKVQAWSGEQLSPIAYIDSSSTGTQAWMFWNRAERKVCVSFRGTESNRREDVLTDLNLIPDRMDPDSLEEKKFWMLFPELLSPAKLFAKKKAEHDVAVENGAQKGGHFNMHGGFRVAYNSVRPTVLKLLDTLLAAEQEPWTLYITGHSLGGALSTLCTWDCARRTWTTPHKPRLVHYNYGSPRVGDEKFARAFNEIVPVAWRFGNKNDVVTAVPLQSRNYCHVGRKAELDETSEALLTVHAPATDEATQDKPGVTEGEVIKKLMREGIAEHSGANYRHNLLALAAINMLDIK